MLEEPPKAVFSFSGPTLPVRLCTWPSAGILLVFGAFGQGGGGFALLSATALATLIATACNVITWLVDKGASGNYVDNDIICPIRVAERQTMGISPSRTKGITSEQHELMATASVNLLHGTVIDMERTEHRVDVSSHVAAGLGGHLFSDKVASTHGVITIFDRNLPYIELGSCVLKTIGAVLEQSVCDKARPLHVLHDAQCPRRAGTGGHQARPR